jgi:hypothetical protein
LNEEHELIIIRIYHRDVTETESRTPRKREREGGGDVLRFSPPSHERPGTLWASLGHCQDPKKEQKLLKSPKDCDDKRKHAKKRRL